MATANNFVFDTNVIVSAVLLPRSVPRQAFNIAIRTGKLIASPESIAELEEVLRRPHLEKYVAEAERLEFLVDYLGAADLIIPSVKITDCRDAKDNKFLELAMDGKAAQIVTGDADLLVLHPFRGISVVTPQAFLAQPW